MGAGEMMSASLTLREVVRAFHPRTLRSRFHVFRHRASQKRRFLSSLRSSDIFIVGHPKSGNTWLACMLGIIGNGDRASDVNISNIGRFVPTVHRRDDELGNFDNLRSPRMFRNENPLFPELYPRTIYIMRDPRAVYLSYYHHCVHDTGRRDWSIEAFVDEMLANGCIKTLEPGVRRWDIQVSEWERRRSGNRVLFMRYEDLLLQPKDELASALAFLEIRNDEALLETAIQRTQFDTMRKDEERYGAESFPGEKGDKGFFVRKGKADSWRDEMPASAVSKIEAAFGETMRRYGYVV